jgi:hypothetical protein
MSMRKQQIIKLRSWELIFPHNITKFKIYPIKQVITAQRMLKPCLVNNDLVTQMPNLV